MNHRIGTYYLFGAILISLLALAVPPWTLLLLWPAASLAMVAAGYFGAGPRIYGKSGGTHPLWSKAFHLFPFLGHEISRQHYARGCKAWNNLVPGVIIGRHLDEEEAKTLIKEGVTAVLDLTSEFGEPENLRNLQYLNIPLLDLTAPSKSELDRGLAFVENQIRDGSVYIHCKIGYSRTAAFAGSYLLRNGHAENAGEAMAMLKSARPSMFIRPEAAATITGEANS